VEGAAVAPWLEEVSKAGTARVDAARGTEAYLAVHDADAMADLHKAGALAARFMRRVLVTDLEAAVNDEKHLTHKAFSDAAAALVGDRAALAKRNVPLDTDDYDAVVGPSIQSGGEGALAVLTPGKDGVASSAAPLSHDVVILAAGLRYRAMRALCARTLMIDPPPKMQGVYDVVARTHEALIKGLVPGAVISEVVTAVRNALLGEPDLPADATLHKNFGTGCGVRAADRHLVLNTKNAAVLEVGMCFAVTTGLKGVAMCDKHRHPAAAVNKLQSYSVCLGDTVLVTADGPVVLTDKADRSRKNCSYEMAGVAEEEEGEEEDEDEDEEAAKRRRKEARKAAAGSGVATECAGRDRSGRSARLTEKADRSRKGCSYEMAGVQEEEEEEEEEDEDEEAAKRKRKEQRKAALGGGVATEGAGRDRSGRSARLKEKAAAVDPDAAAKRAESQLRYMEAMRLERIAKLKKGGAGGGGGGSAAEEEERAREIVAFAGQADFPPRPRLNQIMVDKAREAVLVPWCGALVPISLLAIKSVVQQDEGDKHFLRLNLYCPQGALGKECAPAIAGAIARFPTASYIKTLNFQARDGRNFVAVEQNIKAALKRLRERRKDEREMVGVREQAKVTVAKGAGAQRRVLEDVDAWPPLGGRGRSQGDLSLHADGLIFTSKKGGEQLQIRYGNIKQAIYQPCEREDKALIHFHLQHPILVNKKQYRDVQFYTELHAAEALEQRGKNEYDPDEMNEEAQARAFRERVNKLFLKFVRWIEDAAGADASNRGGFSRMDTAEDTEDLTFQGTAGKDMSIVRLSAGCIFSVNDRPPLVVVLSDIECVHFERVFFGGKSFDMIIVLKEGAVDKALPQFVKIGQIEMRKLESIKTYLDTLAEVVFTEHATPQVWGTEKGIVAEKVRRADFWEREDAETGEAKLPGMLGVLFSTEEIEAALEEEEEEEEEAYESSEEESEEDSDEDDDDDNEDASDEDDDDDDDDEEEEEAEVRVCVCFAGGAALPSALPAAPLTLHALHHTQRRTQRHTQRAGLGRDGEEGPGRGEAQARRQKEGGRWRRL
jgi:nucleosome binding factor SPN SPT16 subunit